MPVQRNYAIQNQPRVAWNGTASRPIDIRKHIGFAFSFEATADLAADAVFNIEYAMPDEADPCIPGAWAPVPEMATCDSVAEPGPQASVTLPAGTAAGTVCTGTIHCRSGAFIRLVSGGGQVADVLVAAVLHGPTM